MPLTRRLLGVGTDHSTPVLYSHVNRPDCRVSPLQQCSSYQSAIRFQLLKKRLKSFYDPSETFIKLFKFFKVTVEWNSLNWRMTWDPLTTPHCIQHQFDALWLQTICEFGTVTPSFSQSWKGQGPSLEKGNSLRRGVLQIIPPLWHGNLVWATSGVFALGADTATFDLCYPLLCYCYRWAGKLSQDETLLSLEANWIEIVQKRTSIKRNVSSLNLR